VSKLVGIISSHPVIAFDQAVKSVVLEVTKAGKEGSFVLPRRKSEACRMKIFISRINEMGNHTRQGKPS
jgi:hypothetical protein